MIVDPAMISEWVEFWELNDPQTLTQTDIDDKVLEMARAFKFGANCRTRTGKGVSFYRLRLLKSRNEIREEADLWSAPPDIVRLNRCNKVGEPTLYVSDNAKTPFEELQLKSNTEQLACLIHYKSKKQFFTSSVGAKSEYFLDDPKAIFGEGEAGVENEYNWNQLSRFIKSLFSTPAKEETDSHYLISEAICRLWMNIHDAVGWTYPSVQNATGDNFALQPEHEKECLEIDRFWAVRLNEITEAFIKKNGEGIIRTSDIQDKAVLKNSFVNLNSMDSFFPHQLPFFRRKGRVFAPVVVNHGRVRNGSAEWL